MVPGGGTLAPMWLIVLLEILWVFLSLVLIGIILLQRGRGGGLVGALGGAGGNSAFGTKAGDVFTKITVGIFAGWLLTAIVLVWTARPDKYGDLANGNAAAAKSGDGKKAGASDDAKGGGKEVENTSPVAPPAPKTPDGKADAKAPVAPELPKADAFKADAPKVDAPKADAPKAVDPKVEPKAAAGKSEPPKTEPPKAKPEAPKVEPPKVEPPKADAAKTPAPAGAEKK